MLPIRRSVALTLALLIGPVGCATHTVSLAEGPREYVPEDYKRVLKRWTRSRELLSIEEFDNVLTVTATFETWDFRWAYVMRYAQDYRLTVEQRQALLGRSLAETRRAHQFFVAMYAQRHKWADLTMDDPAWIVRLIDDRGGETVPQEIIEIKKPGAIERTYYPYTSPWRRIYRVSFPAVRADGNPTISPSARWVGLRFAGAQGNDQLVWALNPTDTNRMESLD